MIKELSYEPVGPYPYDKNAIDISLDNKNKFSAKDAKIAVQTLDSELAKGRPVLTSINWKAGHTGNRDKITDHWILIIGKNQDEKGTYYLFFDPPTGDADHGTSDQNKLYIQKNGSISGTYTTKGGSKRSYFVSQVRKAKTKK